MKGALGPDPLGNMPMQIERDGRAKPQAASDKLQKIFDMKITCGMIPYNLNRKEKHYGLFSTKNTS